MNFTFSFLDISGFLDSSAFPKRKKSLIQDKISDSNLEEELYIAGYYNAVIGFCNYAMVKNNKE